MAHENSNTNDLENFTLDFWQKSTALLSATRNANTANTLTHHHQLECLMLKCPPMSLQNRILNISRLTQTLLVNNTRENCQTTSQRQSTPTPPSLSSTSKNRPATTTRCQSSPLNTNGAQPSEGASATPITIPISHTSRAEQATDQGPPHRSARACEEPRARYKKGDEIIIGVKDTSGNIKNWRGFLGRQNMMSGKWYVMTPDWQGYASENSFRPAPQGELV